MKRTYANSFMSLEPQVHHFPEGSAVAACLTLAKQQAEASGDWELSLVSVDSDGREKYYSLRDAPHPGRRSEQFKGVPSISAENKAAMAEEMRPVLNMWKHQVRGGMPNDMGLPGPLWMNASIHRYWPVTSGMDEHIDFDNGSSRKCFAGNLVFIFPLQDSTAHEIEKGEKHMEKLRQLPYTPPPATPDGALAFGDKLTVLPPESGVKMVFIPNGVRHSVHSPPEGKTRYMLKAPLFYFAKNTAHPQWWLRGATREQCKTSDWAAIEKAGNEEVCARLTELDRQEWEIRQPDYRPLQDSAFYEMQAMRERDQQAEDRKAWTGSDE